MNFNYFIPTKILFGAGKLNELANETFPGKKALIVISAGKSVFTNGSLPRLEKILQDKKIQYVIFNKILPNPVLKHVMEGAQVANDENCDFVIGLGGGSSIDAAKSIAVMATNSGDYWDYISGGSGKEKPLEADALPIVAITTTAGTGTEADPWTVITKEETNEKIGFGASCTFPVLSVVDPELMLTVPEKLTAYQGFDALFHATEGYIANIATPISDAYALKSIELIAKNLPQAVKNGNDLEARTNIALANTISGMVESTSSCTSEHSMEHALSANYPELPHGAGLIMLSESYYTFFADKCPDRMLKMAEAMGVDIAKLADDKKQTAFVDALVQLQKDCNVYGLKMSDYGIQKEDIKKFAENARHTMGALFTLDRYELSLEDTMYIMEKAYC